METSVSLYHDTDEPPLDRFSGSGQRMMTSQTGSTGKIILPVFIVALDQKIHNRISSVKHVIFRVRNASVGELRLAIMEGIVRLEVWGSCVSKISRENMTPELTLSLTRG